MFFLFFITFKALTCFSTGTFGATGPSVFTGQPQSLQEPGQDTLYGTAYQAFQIQIDNAYYSWYEYSFVVVDLSGAPSVKPLQTLGYFSSNPE